MLNIMFSLLRLQKIEVDIGILRCRFLAFSELWIKRHFHSLIFHSRKLIFLTISGFINWDDSYDIFLRLS